MGANPSADIGEQQMTAALTDEGRQEPIGEGDQQEKLLEQALATGTPLDAQRVAELLRATRNARLALNL